MDINKVNKILNDIKIFNEDAASNLSSAVNSISKGEPVDDAQTYTIIGQLMSIINLQSEIIESQSKKTTLNNDIVENLSDVAGSSVDIFMDEFSSRSDEVFQVKMKSIKSRMDDYGKEFNENLSSYKEHNDDFVSKKIRSILKIVKPIQDYMGKPFIRFLSTLLTSIFGAYITIQMMQWYAQSSF